MHVRQSLLHTFAPLIILAAVSAEAWAGPVTISPPNGGQVQITVTYRNGSTVTAKTTDNGPADQNSAAGTFTFTVPDEANAVNVQIISVGAMGALPAPAVMDFGVAGLLSFEPIDLFAFSSADANTILLTQTNVPFFTSGANPFSEGQQFTATNGLYSAADGIIFRDATSLYSGFFDVFFELGPIAINNLPLYTGGVMVQPSMAFRVPEPGSLALVGLGMIGLAFRSRSAGVRSDIRTC